MFSTRRASAPPAEESPYVLDAQVGFLLRVAMQRHTAIFMSRMVEGLTQTQFAALSKLRQVGACSQNRLGRLIFLDAATIKGVVDRLHLRGFVTSAPDPHDRRRRALVLTPEGRRVIAEAEKVAAEITAETLAPLSEEDRETAVRLLRALG